MLSPVWPITRRSAFLILFGAGYLLFGFRYVSQPLSTSSQDNLRLALTIAPIQFYGALWMLSGAVAVVTGVLRWHKAFGFGALSGVSCMWGTVYLLCWGDGTFHGGWGSAAAMFMIGGAVQVVAGLVDGIPKAAR